MAVRAVAAGLAAGAEADRMADSTVAADTIVVDTVADTEGIVGMLALLVVSVAGAAFEGLQVVGVAAGAFRHRDCAAGAMA